MSVEIESRSTGRWGETSYGALHALAEQYGTPFFLYDADAINRRIVRVRETLGQLVSVYYAVKANPNLELLRALRDVADGLDISSGGELQQASIAGFDMAKLSFAGPCKTSAEIMAAVTRGVGCISIESTRELAACIDAARQTGTRAGVTVRVNPQTINRFFGIKMGGKPIQFGIDEEELGGVLETVSAHSESLSFRGIHVYVGSQCFDASGVVHSVQDTLRLALEIEATAGLPCQLINFGGGFGISHGADGHELDLEQLAMGLVPMLRDFVQASASERKLVFELGRYLSAVAGIYVSRVISRKVSRGKTFVIVDGGLHHHLAAAGTFGAALRTNYAIANLTRPEAPKVRCSVAGPSCNPTDLLAVDIDLPECREGDLIAVMNAGSYGFTASPILFLGRQTPAELVRRNGEIVLAREVRSVTDFN